MYVSTCISRYTRTRKHTHTHTHTHTHNTYIYTIYAQTHTHTYAYAYVSVQMYMRQVSLGYIYAEHARTSVLGAEVVMLLLLLYFQASQIWRQVKAVGRYP